MLVHLWLHLWEVFRWVPQSCNMYVCYLCDSTTWLSYIHLPVELHRRLLFLWELRYDIQLNPWPSVVVLRAQSEDEYKQSMFLNTYTHWNAEIIFLSDLKQAYNFIYLQREKETKAGLFERGNQRQQYHAITFYILTLLLVHICVSTLDTNTPLLDGCLRAT